MCKRWAAIVLQRAKQWIDVDLIAWARQNAAAIIAAEIITVRRNGAAAVKEITAGSAGIQDGVYDLECPAIPNAASIVRRIAAESAVGYEQRLDAAVHDTAAESRLATASVCGVAA